MNEDSGEANFTTDDGRPVYVDVDGIEHEAAPSAPSVQEDQHVERNDGLGWARARFDGKTKELEPEDRMGNFEIQDLMSGYNEPE